MTPKQLVKLREQITTLKETKSYANTSYVSGYIDALVDSGVLSGGFVKMMSQPDVMLDSLTSLYGGKANRK